MPMTSADFESTFNRPFEASGEAHGRVNIIGEHTDYCDGFALPTLISHKIEVEIAARDDNEIRGLSSEFGSQNGVIGKIEAESWLRFVEGAIAFVNQKGGTIQGLDILTRTSIPAGAGVSSSAAFEIALMRALSQLADISLTANEMAVIGQQIEHDYIGTKCGIMDQMAVAHAQQGQALWLDCRSLESRILPLPQIMRLAVIHSGSNRKLSSSAYNERLEQTIQAAQLCGKQKLRDVTMADIASFDDALLKRRASHVIGENERVKKAVSAIKNGDMKTLGHLMVESHNSLRDDYEVSSPALDKLVQDALAAGAFGARLTGAGFGGCIVVLLEDGNEEATLNAILKANPDAYLVDSQ